MEKRSCHVLINPNVWNEFKDLCNEKGYRKTNEVIEALLIAFNQRKIDFEITVKKTTSIDVHVK